MRHLLIIPFLLASAVGAVPALAQTAPAPAPATPPSNPAGLITPYGDFRLRHEFVEQAGLPDDAHATTLRARLGVRVSPVSGLTAVIEGEAIAALDNALYNDTTNGVGRRPVVADPPDILLNQAYLRWQGGPKLTATVGRQAVNYDNQRWIGSVGWRQNDQTLDAVQISIEPAPGQPIAASFAHAWRVNRVFGPDSPQGVWRDTAISMARVGIRVADGHNALAFGYWLDVPAAPSLSSQTLGARISGGAALAPGWRGLYALEYARQTPHGGNLATSAHTYLLVEPGVSHGPTTLKLGYERLSGDGRTALQTPLATLHAFNGWADKFLTTPAGGLRDVYVDLGHTFPKATPAIAGASLRFAFHDFRSTRGDVHYGQEWNAMVAYPFTPWLTGMIKGARYDADSFATDTTKIWAQLEARF